MIGTGQSNSDSIAISIVVPCFNEALRIESTVQEMLTVIPTLGLGKFEIILVDDGSTDDTVRVATNLIANSAQSISIVKHALNRGKGAAIRTGAAAALGEYILMADADGSTPIGELKKLITTARTGADIVIGSRAIPDDTVKLKTAIHRKFLGRLFNGVVNALVLPGIHDTQCGFKLFSRRVVHELFPKLKVDHFGFDIELLMMAHLSGFSIKEIAVNWNHVPGSKVNLVTDSAKMLWMVIGLWFTHRVWARSGH